VDQLELGIEEGKARALNADRVDFWKAAADRWLADLPVGFEFTADTLVARLGRPDVPGSRERPNNVIGAWLSGKAKRGAIRWSGRYRRSRRAEGHGNQQRIWLKAASSAT
jgi:hypothetical protein